MPDRFQWFRFPGQPAEMFSEPPGWRIRKIITHDGKEYRLYREDTVEAKPEMVSLDYNVLMAHVEKYRYE